MRCGIRLLIFVLLLRASALDARAQDQPGATPPTQPRAAAPAPASGPASLPAQKPQKPFRKARRVITNDDIDGIGSIYKGAYGPDLSYVNDCDRGASNRCAWLRTFIPAACNGRRTCSTPLSE